MYVFNYLCLRGGRLFSLCSKTMMPRNICWGLVRAGQYLERETWGVEGKHGEWRGNMVSGGAIWGVGEQFRV